MKGSAIPSSISFLPGCPEAALTCIWHGRKNHSICITSQLIVRMAQPWIPSRKSRASWRDGEGGGGIPVWNWEGPKEVSHSGQCSVTETSPSLLLVAGEQNTDLPGLLWLVALWWLLEYIPLWTSWSLQIHNWKLIWAQGLGKQSHSFPLWSRRGSVHLDTSLWPWLKPIGAGDSES